MIIENHLKSQLKSFPRKKTPRKKLMSRDEIRKVLADVLYEYRVEADFARELGYQSGYVNKVKQGESAPSPKILERLGYEKVTMYRRVGK